MKKIVFVLLFAIVVQGFCSAWDGFDYDSGSFIEIEHGQYVRSGQDIDIYDYGSGGYKTVEVQSVSRDEVEVYDYDTGEYRTFDMD